MDALADLLQRHVDTGLVTGAVALVDGPTGAEVAVAGHRDLAREVPMTRDTLFRVASVTKPMTAALVLSLVEEGRVRLDDPVDRWLPELAAPRVVRSPSSPVDDVVPAYRSVTVEDLLTMRAGWGWSSRWDLPAVEMLAERIERQGVPHEPRTPDQWLADLAEVPMLHQPGEAWLYNTCSDLQGVLVSRVLDQSLAAAMAERVTRPLGMDETGFVVPVGQADRLADCTVAGEDGVLVRFEEPPGSFLEPPGFPSGAGGLVSTLDDLRRFGAALLRGGSPVLRPETVRAMTTDHLTAAQRAGGELFLDGQGWGYGGGVDVARTPPRSAWNVPGRYGWVGGTGTASYVVPAAPGRGAASYVLLTQRMMGGPDDGALLGDFCTYAARRTAS